MGELAEVATADRGSADVPTGTSVTWLTNQRNTWRLPQVLPRLRGVREPASLELLLDLSQDFVSITRARLARIVSGKTPLSLV